MLYSIIIVVMALTIPVIAFLSFRAGYRAAQAIKEDKADIPPAVTFARSRDAPNPEVERINRILANIDRYDGTNQGQEAIK